MIDEFVKRSNIRNCSIWKIWEISKFNQYFTIWKIIKYFGCSNNLKKNEKKINSIIKLSHNSSFVMLIFEILKFRNIGRSTFRCSKFSFPPTKIFWDRPGLLLAYLQTRPKLYVVCMTSWRHIAAFFFSWNSRGTLHIIYISYPLSTDSTNRCLITRIHLYTSAWCTKANSSLFFPLSYSFSLIR